MGKRDGVTVLSIGPKRCHIFLLAPFVNLSSKMEMPLTLPDFKQYYKAIVIKTASTMIQKQTYGSMEQIESPEINSHLRSINLQQRRQEYTMDKSQSFQQVVLAKLDSYM